MRLHRLRLKDFRGTVERELLFPVSGVVVVEGANEVGKTSLVDALDLLLTEKDSSTKSAVRAVKPVGRDAGSEVEAEISTGPYRFTYRKRWHRSTETVLTVHAPRAEQLTGVPAHERVRHMLAETLDDGLWRALRMMQAAPLSQVPLAGSGALAAALDAAAGTVGDGGRSDSLVEAVEREYLRWYTPGGRATGPLRAAEEELAQARQRADDAQRALDDAARDVDRHAALSAELRGLSAERTTAASDLASSQARWDVVEALRTRLEEARRDADDARRDHERAEQERAVRRDVVADEQRRAAAVASLQTEVDARAEAVATSAALLGEHDRTVADLDLAARSSASAADVARAAADRVHDLVELARLERRLDRLVSLGGRVEAAERSVHEAGVDAVRWRAVEKASAALDLAGARLSAAAARVVLEPLATVAATVSVTVDGATVDLPAGGRHEVRVAQPVAVVLPDVLRVTVLPGSAGDDVAAAVGEARRALADALAAAGVEDVRTARARHEQRRHAEDELALLHRQLADELGSDDVRTVRRSVAAIRSRLAGAGTVAVASDPFPAPPGRAGDAGARPCVGDGRRADECGGDGPGADCGGADPVRLREDSAAAARACAEARSELDAARAARAGCAEQLAVAELDLVRAQAALQAARTELAGVRQRLSALRAEVADPDVADHADRAGERAGVAALEERVLQARLRDADPDSLRPLLDNAREVMSRLAADVAARQQELAAVAARLEVVGGLGRQQQLHDAATALAAAEEHAARLRRRACAARMLRETLLRHREQARRQYVEPYREHVIRLGRIVFGADFAVDVDSELRIISRTRAGTTVPFEVLSSGAKEQLGIIARLACAALVHEADGVPVLIDDALGYSDPDRLRRVGAVLSVAASSAQVIVLTCTPERYRSVGSAHVISLGDRSCSSDHSSSDSSRAATG